MEPFNRCLTSDAASKQRGRSEASLRKIEQTVEKLFGPDWLKAGIPKDFNLRKARSALRTLRGYKTHLMWQLISSKDVKIMEEPMSFANADVQKHLEARWESLTENARKMEFCQVAIGWMLGVVQAKNGTTPEEPIDFGGERDEDLMKYGIALGRVTSKKQLAHFAEPSEVEIQQFNLEVADFIDMWLGRSQIDNLNTATALYRNPELEIQLQQYLNEGEDIGTGPFQRFTPTELHAYLGFPPDRQLPVGFRKFTADDPKAIPDGAHEESFEGSSPVSISWHQLVFVAVLFTHLTKCS
ncbi:hypothetical protein BDP27DRAFT_173247 [Rhodocollybia butyracea]|uniref:Uncharacterized protein n=1 Tax=Rhodocollybia butyracea TaxID=206335 RepID=A0A9P5PLL5_9AGAR|nr:hypothetical protein BDP27DRAFT_173247 [Rhodocollybia butyracea]